MNDTAARVRYTLDELTAAARGPLAAAISGDRREPAAKRARSEVAA